MRLTERPETTRRDPRAILVDWLAVYPEICALIGGPLPVGDDAKIALFEHLYDQPDARSIIERLAARFTREL